MSAHSKSAKEAKAAAKRAKKAGAKQRAANAQTPKPATVKKG